MRQKAPTLVIAFAAIGLSLAGCAARNQGPAQEAGNNDDDAYCRASGEPGSPPYVACRKDRDVMRQRAEAKADRSQRNLGEYMLNHRD